MSTTRYPNRTPAGARLSVTTWGRDFKMLDIDRWPIKTNWPEAGRRELSRLARHLSWLAMCSRRKACYVVVSGFKTAGTIYCPNAVVDELLAVLVSAEDGDVSRVTPVADSRGGRRRRGRSPEQGGQVGCCPGGCRRVRGRRAGASPFGYPGRGAPMSTDRLPPAQDLMARMLGPTLRRTADGRLLHAPCADRTA